ncbi:transcriptional regulator, TetR family [Formosa agariphila KMM 3901]|uniref:Transcriptional regulator, TetR family n=1 Tax=Formosa agariphila (strain DSM 15362 / KCTC 12365 / LMG 23005 / KMM 3901 / M-2Alg 35-1) TaxID=1347342 RepID=T2KLM8_FORAG|nr:TetR/AcrR family transcriptional regulator [Formosa agariphila]CDF79353.1 transcriptional regulator, TetR family [Formosa agariphila KMM 3901]
MPVLKKSEIKRAALVKATINLVNNQGFHAAPMAKIAKMANVSPATIYLYFENKQDLINQVYKEVKAEYMTFAFETYKSDLSIEAGFELVWRRMADYKLKDIEKGFFLSQCENTPMIDAESRLEGIQNLKPLLDLWDRGISEQIIKPVSHHILYAYSIYPLAFLLNAHKRGDFKITKQHLDDAYQAAWSSIKL